MICVCGEALIDLAPAGDDLWRAQPGGGPANTAVALARLGVPTTMLARLSDDVFGRRLRTHLTDSGVDLSSAVTASEPSTLAIVDVDPAGSAGYTFHRVGTADWQWRDDELPDELGDEVTAMHAGSMALLLPPGGEALERLLRREQGRRVISIDPNVRPALWPDRTAYRRRVERWVALADIVKVSADDLHWLCPGVAVGQVATRWAALGPALVVVTLGADGALAARPGRGLLTRAGWPARVVDTVGAGDAFTAGLLAALYEGGRLTAEGLTILGDDALEEALSFAARVAGVTCERAGADPPYRQALA